MTVAVESAAPPRGIRLAVVDGDPEFVAGLDEQCRLEGWKMSQVTSLTLDPQNVRAAKVNILLLDPSGLGARGWDRLEFFCRTVPDIPVIVCTGPSSVSERVRGLRLGADDWITKPCDLTELMARIERVTLDRRLGPVVESEVDLVAGEIELRPEGHLARVKGQIVGLSPREFEVLRLFMSESGQPLARDTIFQQVWGYAMPWGDRSVDVYVLRLRHKLRNLSPDWLYLHTHHRYGYRFEARPRISG